MKYDGLPWVCPGFDPSKTLSSCMPEGMQHAPGSGRRCSPGRGFKKDIPIIPVPVTVSALAPPGDALAVDVELLDGPNELLH
jgi:hypothetical protein